MTIEVLDTYFRSFLEIDGYASIDDSLNGIQVGNDGGDIAKAAFAVDACLETFEAATQAGADLLFVHHGLFWGKPQRIVGTFRRRIEYLLQNRLALYAVHLPLDQHPLLGNNAGLSDLLGITNPEPFGTYHGKKIGYKGNLAEPLTVQAAVQRIAFKDRPPLGVFPFGKQVNATCAVVSGGAAFEALQAMEEGIDLYVTGEASHSVYHQALEGGLNMIAGGHYSTEVWGVRRVMERLAADTGLEVEFIDAPTGL